MKNKIKMALANIKAFTDKHFEVFYFILFVIATAICTVIAKHKCLLLYNWQCVLVGLFSASPFYIVPLVCGAIRYFLHSDKSAEVKEEKNNG